MSILKWPVFLSHSVRQRTLIRLCIGSKTFWNSISNPQTNSHIDSDCSFKKLYIHIYIMHTLVDKEDDTKGDLNEMKSVRKARREPDRDGEWNIILNAFHRDAIVLVQTFNLHLTTNRRGGGEGGFRGN